MSEQASGPALPGEECRVPPHESWSDLERWVWQEVGSGRIADIDAKLGKSADPKKPEDWGPERRLNGRFIETILLHDPWRRAIPRQGVRIVGALFDEPVDLVEAEIAHEFWLVRSRFTSDVDLSGIRTRSLLSLSGSVFTGTLNMDSASIGGDLFMREGAEFAAVELVGAKVGGQLDITGAKVIGTLNMDAASIGGSLFMHGGAEFAEVILRRAQIGGQLALVRAKVTGTLTMDSASIGGSLFMSEGAEFAAVDLRGAKIEGQLDMTGAKVTGTLDMDSAGIGGSLFMSEGAEFAEVDLRGAKIGGQLDMTGAKITGTLTMDSTSIGRDLFMRDARFLKPIDFVFSKVGGNLDLRGAKVAGLDLTGARVDGELRLASGAWLPTWDDGARLVLRNTRVGAVQDEPGAWPKDLELDGFTYERFGGLGADPQAAVGTRRSMWFIDWLKRDEPYTPQPYHQCAKMLREMGHPEMANDVLYAGRERERRELWKRSGSLRGCARAAGLWLLKAMMGYGYGYRYFWSFWWVAGLVLIGTCLLGGTGEYLKIPGVIPWSAASWQSTFYNVVDLIMYNLDLLLPIVSLDDRYEKVVLSVPLRYYFYFEKLMGYVLASFLIAGLAGLTK
jgi:uncharacterized protein YjbI with pentapeptide repeats